MGAPERSFEDLNRALIKQLRFAEPPQGLVQHPKVVQSHRDFRMVPAKEAVLDAQCPPVQICRRVAIAAAKYERREIVQQFSDLGRIRPARFFCDLERLAIRGLRPVELRLRLVVRGQCRQARGDLSVSVAEKSPMQLDGLMEQAFCAARMAESGFKFAAQAKCACRVRRIFVASVDKRSQTVIASAIRPVIWYSSAIFCRTRPRTDTFPACPFPARREGLGLDTFRLHRTRLATRSNPRVGARCRCAGKDPAARAARPGCDGRISAALANSPRPARTVAIP
jgi:hypothetical protein